MNDVGLIETVLNLTGLCVGNSLSNVRSNGTCLGRGHESARSENFTETADKAHHVGSGDSNVKFHPALALNSCNKVFSADNLSACGFGCLCVIALCKNSNANLLARSVGKDNSTANLLVGVTGVNTEADMGFDGFVKFCGCGLYCEFESVRRIIKCCSVKKLCAFNILFSMFHNFILL